jgi:hypothetical protein
MRQHTARYMWVPAALVVGTAAVAAVLTARSMTWLLLGFFGWQFFHFQKQNLGIAALAARAHHARSLSQVERRALVGAGIGGVAGLVGHAHLLQVPYAPNSDLLFAAGGVCFALSVALGLAAAARRPRAHRPTEFIAVYAVSLLFFGPVWLFASPYAAVAGLTIAHGVQYLLLMGLLAAADRPGRPRALGLLVLLNLALVAGVALNALSHLHGNSLLQRLLFGAYLGLVMTHFVVDAGLWRLRDQFPRAFLRQRLPFLLDV